MSEPKSNEAAPAEAPAEATPAEGAGPVVEHKPQLFRGKPLEEFFSEEGDAPPAETKPAAPVAPEPVKPTPPKPEPMAKAFAELSKREAKQRAEYAARDAEFKTRETKLAEQQAAIQNLLEDPIGNLEKLGISYESLTEQVLNGRKAPADLKQRAEIAKLKAQVEAREKAEQEREAKAKADAEKAQAEAQLSAFKAGVTKTVTEAGETFELINALGEHGLVYDVINEHAARTGELLDVTEAAAQVEAHLEARELAKTQRVLQTKKLGAKLAPVSPAHQRPSGGQSATSGQSPKTLTASNAVATSSVSHTPLTDDERRAKARAILESGQP